MHFALALLLGQLCVFDDGVRKACSIHAVDCRGPGIACSIVNGKWVVTVTATLADGGAVVSIPVCSAGYVLTGDGSVLSCVNTITNATSATSATTATTATTAGAFSSNPADCAANQYATTIAANGDLTCSQVATSQLSGTVTNAQLASSYSGVGSCGTNTWASTLNTNAAPTCTQPAFSNISGTATDSQLASAYSGVGACGTHLWASTLTRNSAPTCTQIAYSDLSGSPVAGGSPPQVQWNSSGLLAGMTNYQSDGTRPLVVAETAIPATPASKALHFNLAVGDAGFPFPVTLDSMFTVPVPVGIRSLWASHSTSYTLHYMSHFLPIWGGTSANTADNGTGQALTFNDTSNNTIAWDSTTWKGRQKMTGLTSGTSGNNIASLRDSNRHSWLGNASGAGGFVFRLRTCIASANVHQRSFFGLAALTTDFVATLEPSQQVNSIYFGCDNGAAAQTTLRVCSNDNTGSATCSGSLGASFPCQTNPACYDFWFTAKPNASVVHYFVERLDSAASAEGDITSDLPQNTVQLSMHSYMNSADAGVAVRQDWVAFETLDNL